MTSSVFWSDVVVSSYVEFKVNDVEGVREFYASAFGANTFFYPEGLVYTVGNNYHCAHHPSNVVATIDLLQHYSAGHNNSKHRSVVGVGPCTHFIFTQGGYTSGRAVTVCDAMTSYFISLFCLVLTSMTKMKDPWVKVGGFISIP